MRQGSLLINKVSSTRERNISPRLSQPLLSVHPLDAADNAGAGPEQGHGALAGLRLRQHRRPESERREESAAAREDGPAEARGRLSGYSRLPHQRTERRAAREHHRAQPQLVLRTVSMPT